MLICCSLRPRRAPYTPYPFAGGGANTGDPPAVSYSQMDQYRDLCRKNPEILRVMENVLRIGSYLIPVSLRRLLFLA